jgi:cytochrome c556
MATLMAGRAAMAGLALSPIMQSWNQQRHAIDAMMSGRSPYDEAAIRHAVKLYVADASAVAGHLGGTSAAARDFRGRFAAFAAQGRRALDSVGQPAAFRPNLRRIADDCQSCHAVYN